MVDLTSFCSVLWYSVCQLELEVSSFSALLYVMTRGGRVLSCHPNSSCTKATGGFSCPAAPDLPQPSTTAVRPTSSAPLVSAPRSDRSFSSFHLKLPVSGVWLPSPTQAHSLLQQLNCSLSSWYMATTVMILHENPGYNRNSSDQKYSGCVKK